MNKTMASLIIFNLIVLAVFLGGCAAYPVGHDTHTNQEHAQFLNHLGEGTSEDLEDPAATSP